MRIDLIVDIADVRMQKGTYSAVIMHLEWPSERPLPRTNDVIHLDDDDLTVTEVGHNLSGYFDAPMITLSAVRQGLVDDKVKWFEMIAEDLDHYGIPGVVLGIEMMPGVW